MLEDAHPFVRLAFYIGLMLLVKFFFWYKKKQKRYSKMS